MTPLAPPTRRGFAALPRFGVIAARFVAWNNARMTRRALRRLSLHELDDIGLSRVSFD